MKNIVAFGASNSKMSINKQFAAYTANILVGVKVNFLDLNDFEMPIYSIDKENDTGIPDLAHQFKKLIHEADGLVISFAEHNGAYSVAYKNIYDWASRIKGTFMENKPMLLLATAPGPRGGASVLSLAASYFRRRNESKIVSFSLPEFSSNFSEDKGILKKGLSNSYQEAIESFSVILNS